MGAGFPHPWNSVLQPRPSLWLFHPLYPAPWGAGGSEPLESPQLAGRAGAPRRASREGVAREALCTQLPRAAGTAEEAGSAGTRVTMRDGFGFLQRQLCSHVLRGPCCGFQCCFMGSPGNSSLETSRLTHQLMQQLQTHHTHTHNQPGPLRVHGLLAWPPGLPGVLPTSG